ncbi:MAG: precorrin-6A reductase, partial [Lachnospiraceae bacterium]|nr:precorrin-6A reductase [Lachnospiraceae bacterium]
MKKVLIFAGTTEGRVLAKRLEAAGVFCEVCVATQYGEQLLEESGNLMVRRGRLDAGQMRELYGEQEYAAVVDATHPFAAVVTENILESLKGKEIPYFRLARDVKTELGELPDCLFFETAAECAAALEKVPGNILLTTGSKELSLFCSKESLRKRLIVRVLPGMESLELCIKNGLEGRQIIAMQGPFTKEMNLAMFHQYGIACLVTKESGRTGGVDEKLEAALEAKIPCCMIRRPQTAEKIREDSPEEVWQQLSKLLDIRESSCAGLDIVLAGIGMGCEETMTMQLVNRIQETDYLFGAERMIRPFCPKREKFPYYLAGDILPKLKQLQKENQGTLRVTILFSGDTGFFSGCEKLYASLKELENAAVRVYPGISSVAALGAAFAVSWQDAAIVSTHGEKREKWSTEILYEVRHGRKVFFLTSGPEDVRAVGKLLEDNGYADCCRLLIGYQLCYPEEETYDLQPRECGQIQRPGLYCGMILPGKRPAGPAEWTENSICPGIPDEAFLR